MIRIRVTANWAENHQENVRNFLNYTCTENMDYKWKDLYIVDYNDKDYDYNIIFNFPLDDNYDPKKTIVFSCEPDYVVEYFNKKNDKYNFDFTKDRENEFFKIFDIENNFSVNGAWKIWVPFNELYFKRYYKYNTISSIYNSDEQTKCKIFKNNLLRFCLNEMPDINIFGNIELNSINYKGPIEIVENVYGSYKYSICVEDQIKNNFFTDNIRDSILCECLTFYCGCPNIEKFIDPACYIKLDFDDIEKSYNIIINSIKNDEWKKRVDSIRNEKKRIMKELNPLNIINSIILNKDEKLKV